MTSNSDASRESLASPIGVPSIQTMSTLSAPLRDRLEIIEISGYTTDEKVAIAKRHLVPQKLERTGLGEGSVIFPDESLAIVIRDYTREAGVRNLERQIGTVARKIAAKVAMAMPARCGVA